MSDLYNLSDPTLVVVLFRKNRRVEVVLKHRRSPAKLAFEFEEGEERGSVSMTVKIFGVVYYLARDGDSIIFNRDAADRATLLVEPHHTTGSFKLRCGEDYLRHSQSILTFGSFQLGDSRAGGRPSANPTC